MPVVEPEGFSGEESARLFAPVADRSVVALAVSGGADSLALMILAKRWRDDLTARPRVVVLTVDHQLRPSSADEARMVASSAAECGFDHRTLRWSGPKPETGIEEAARDARYALLRAAARNEGAHDLLTAHHQDDQAETVLMRLGGGSGVAGLSGMRARRDLGDGVMLHRPLLRVSRARLHALVTEAGWRPVMDETNADPRFLRPRLRALMPAMESVGLSPHRIAQSAERLGHADEALEHYTDMLLRDAVATDAFAVARLDRVAFADAPIEIRRRALARLVAALGEKSWPPPRGDRLAALDSAIHSDDRFRRTLGGVEIAAEGDHVSIYRECGRRALPVLPVRTGATGIWDRRFAFRLEEGPRKGLVIGPLGRDRIEGDALVGVPRRAAAALPVLRKDGEIVAVPGGKSGDRRVVAMFRSVIDESIFAANEAGRDRTVST